MQVNRPAATDARQVEATAGPVERGVRAHSPSTNQARMLIDAFPVGRVRPSPRDRSASGSAGVAPRRRGVRLDAGLGRDAGARAAIERSAGRPRPIDHTFMSARSVIEVFTTSGVENKKMHDQYDGS